MTAFLDTNVLVYAYDSAEPEKQDCALRLLTRLGHSECVISSQVLSEFYTAVRRLPDPLSEAGATAATRALLGWRVISVNGALVERALDIRERWQPSYWDALIVAAAEQSGAAVLYSEDFTHGQSIAGLEIVNPFAELADSAGRLAPHHL